MTRRPRATGVLLGFWIVLATTVTVGVAAPDAGAQQGGWTGNVNIFLGGKALDEDDWAPAEDQGEIGVLFDFRPRNWPVNFAVDLLYGAAEENAFLPGFGLVEAESTTSELNLGIRKIFELSILRPYIGGGLALVRGKFESLGVSDTDTGVGFWVNGGAYVTLAEHFNIGLDLRFSSADVTLFGVDADAGGGHFGLLLGYHW